MRAYEEARSPDFAWRRQYNLPPNDPRYLEIGEDEMLVDLMAHAIVALDMKREADPRQAIRELAADEDAQARMIQRTRDFLRDPGTRQALRWIDEHMQHRG